MPAASSIGRENGDEETKDGKFLLSFNISKYETSIDKNEFNINENEQTIKALKKQIVDGHGTSEDKDEITRLQKWNQTAKEENVQSKIWINERTRQPDLVQQQSPAPANDTLSAVK
jgi:capsule polysaccharide export protein KpsC/LpsZ